MDHNKLGLADSLIEAVKEVVNKSKGEVALSEMKHMGSYTQSHIIKKIRSGEWEATTDVVPGRHVELRHHRGKRITVHVERDPVKEDFEQLDELKSSTLKSYADKKMEVVKKRYAALTARQRAGEKISDKEMKDYNTATKKDLDNRNKALDKAAKKIMVPSMAREQVEQILELTREQLEEIEALAAKHGLTKD